MPDRLLASAAMTTLLCLTTTAVPAQTSDPTPGTMNAERGWSSIARCAQEDTERARHTCLDRVLRDAGLLTNEMHARQQRNAFGLEDKAGRAAPSAAASGATRPANTKAPPVTTSRAPASTAVPSAAPAEALNRRAAEEKMPAGAAAAAPSQPSQASPPMQPAQPSPPAQPDRLEVELAAVQKAADGKLFVTTTDGAVWLQNETVDMPQPPVAGDRMTIRKGSMNGYRCSVASTHLTYRCVRSR